VVFLVLTVLGLLSPWIRGLIENKGGGRTGATEKGKNEGNSR
jgi:hypothetical protein